MAAFKFTAYGEDVKVTSLTFTPSLSSALTNVGLYVNGGQVGSNQTTVTNASNITFSSLGTNLLVPAGQSVVVEIRGDAMSSAGTNATGTIAFNIASGVAQGYTSSQSATVSAASGQQLTVASSNVTFAAAAGSAASVKAPNAQGVKIGSFTVQTGSAEGITVNTVNVTLPNGTGQNSMVAANRLTNLTIKDGSTVIASPIGNPVGTSSNSFSTNLSIPMNTTKTFDVYADLGSASAGLTVTPSMTLTFRGNTSNLSTTGSTVAGVLTTANVAVLTGTSTTFKSSSFPALSFLIAGASNVSVGSFNVVSYNGMDIHLALV
jgi:hypothetical protein